ncbi:NAD-dependent epimerase/dehydratase family protein [Proteiniclasticum sp. C24MP]|uniref:NAD-dependent epimerase/dehydratase family protein n=1 Tax=Proteiniclasticum sp. C24MP TaxID=3374101 RepID=UPI0037544EBA
MKELYIVTGASGHLGNVLVRRLVEQNHLVWVFLLDGEKNVVEGVERVYHGDVRNKESMKPVFEDAKEHEVNFIHCAGIVSIKSEYSKLLHDVNVGGTKNVADLCLEYKIHKLVYISSVHAIPDNTHGEVIREIRTFDPQAVTGHYGKTKAEATQYVLDAGERGLSVNVIHPSGIIGPYDFGRGHTTTLITDYCRGKLVAAMAGGFDFVDVRDVAEGIISCAQKGEPGACYLLSNRYYTVKELLDMLSEITGRKKITSYLPLWFVRLTAPLAELYYRILKQPPLYTRFSIFTLSTNNLYSSEKAMNELGYKTREMNETLKDTYDWLVQGGRIKCGEEGG